MSITDDDKRKLFPIVPLKAVDPETVGAPVNCICTGLLELVELKKHPENKNKHPEDQIRLLEHVIYSDGGQGWRSPIVVSSRSGYITRGHGRLLAAQRRGAKYAPVEIQHYRDEREELQDLIADNAIAELSEQGIPDVWELLEELSGAGDIDVGLFGFPDDAFLELTKDLDGIGIENKGQDEPTLKSDVLVQVRCSKDAFEGIRGLIDKLHDTEGVNVFVS